jgi:hypothetical protein
MTYLIAGVVVQWNDPSKSVLYGELGFASETTLETFVTNYVIPGVEDYAAQLSGGNYTDATVPALVKMVAYQAAANVLAYMRTNRMGPVLQNPAGFNLQVPIVKAFTPELVEMLQSKRARIVKASEYKTDKIRDTWLE